MRLLRRKSTMEKAMDMLADSKGTLGLAAAGVALVAGGAMAARSVMRKRRATGGVADSAEAAMHVPVVPGADADPMKDTVGEEPLAWEDVGGEPAGTINFDARPELAEWRAGNGKGRFR